MRQWILLENMFFLDYGDKQVADRIIKRLRNSTYRRHNLMEQIGLLKALLNANIFPDGNILTAGLLIYLFFKVASYWHFYNDRKKISVHFLHGGTLEENGRQNYRPIFRF